MKLITEVSENVKTTIEEAAGGQKKYYIEGTFAVAGMKNQNGRIYPEHTLSEATKKFQKIIEANRAYGELGHPCLSDSAEILTDSGWKHIKDTVEGEMVYTLNPHTRTIEIHPIKEVHINHYKGNMLRIKNRLFDTLVTPYHKFAVYYRDGSPKQITAGEIKEYIDNDVSILAKFCIPKTGKLEKDIQPTIKIGKTVYDLKVFVSFLSLYLAEGCTTKRKGRNNSFSIKLFQNVGVKEQKIDNLLKQMPVNWHKSVKDDKCVWTTHDIELASYLYPLGKSHEKYIPQDILNIIDADLAGEMLDWYILGDGRGDKTRKNHKKSDVFSTSEQMINDLSVVAVVAGYAFKMYSKTDFEDTIIENRIIKAENKRPLHFLQLLKSENVYLDKRHIQIEEVEWDNDVFCISVQNGVFLARDNGYCFWSGNCGPAINLDRVSHMIKKMEPTGDGHTFTGRAHILETPNGLIVQRLLDAGASLGVSTRGMGSLIAKNGYQEVQEDFHLATVDIVADPSAPGAFVEGIMEGKEWLLDNGVYKEVEIQEARNRMDRAARRRDTEAEAIRLFEHLISRL